MIDKILSALKKSGIDTWVLNVSETESVEIFMIRREEDMRRGKTVSAFSATVYHDVEKDGVKMRGASAVQLYPGMSEEELQAKLTDAYGNAVYAANPFYELPDAVNEDRSGADCPDLTEAADAMLAALYAPDTGKTAFINSAEIFAVRRACRTLTSAGTDVSYNTFGVNGEFVVQCTENADVETYCSFDYNTPDTASLTEKAEQALKTVRDRASACKAPEAGEYDVLLTDENVATLLGIYPDKCNAAMVYPGYSTFKEGTPVQEENCSGEKLNIRVFSREPFSRDGIPMPERSLIENGAVKAILGETRMCRYLGIEPTGSYYCMKCLNGTMPFEEMKRGRVLLPVTFSDFQCDSMSGYFGGEIRLAYLFENGTVSIVTGGSISGSLTKKAGELKFSSERFSNASWEGPKAVLIPGVSVAGA